MKRQIYELSYWLRQDIEENFDKIKNLLENFNFEIIQEIPPQKKHLAYPIKKETIGKFGTFYFYADKEKIEDFKNKLRGIQEILRFIILKRKHLKLNK
mgnify:CR=1 FL=1